MSAVFDDAVTDEMKSAVTTSMKNIEQNTPGFRSRPAQKFMIRTVTQAIAGFFGKTRKLVIEAPTGTGKSMGYMIGGIPVGLIMDKSVVISTGTVALQEQLVSRDLPDFMERSGQEFTYAIAKGRGRYVCNRNLFELTGTDSNQSTLDLGNVDLDKGVWPFQPSKDQVKLAHELDDALQSKAWDGDFDEWKGEQVDGQLKSALVTDNAGCSGRSCPYFYKCRYQKAKADIKSANVIVANHDLVMSDVELGGGVLLPNPEETIYIFDEAHHLPDVALKHGSNEFAIEKVTETLKKSLTALTDTMNLLGKQDRAVTDEAKAVRGELNQGLKELNDFLKVNFPEPTNQYRNNWNSKVQEADWRFKLGQPPVELMVPIGRVVQPAENLRSILGKALEALTNAMKEKQVDEKAGSKLNQKLSVILKNLEAVVMTCKDYMREDDLNWAPTAKWISRKTKKGGYKEEYQISACPTSASGILKFGLWDNAFAVILTSATLRSMNSFTRFIEKSGLSYKDGTQYYYLESPFDFQNNGLLEVPNWIAEPNDTARHTSDISDYIKTSVDPNIASLVLFSSRKQMNDVFDTLPKHFQDIVMCQGSMSKTEIINKHKMKIESGKGSIIFGLASFSEGVDLPGNLCEHVIIAKLPFAVPDSPVDATYSEWLEAVNRNPFMEVSVPDACTKLIQSCGRLIRKEDDRGRITLMDKRVLTKRYGQLMLDSLPPYRREILQSPTQLQNKIVGF